MSEKQSAENQNGEKKVTGNQLIDGPRLLPASGGPARQLVILLHGVGADGNDLFALAPQLAQVLPDAAFVSPHAPEPFDMAPTGRQWFSLIDRTPDSIVRGARKAASVLDAFIEAELVHHDLSDADLALVGFSQGTMMALYVALRRAFEKCVSLGILGSIPLNDHVAAVSCGLCQGRAVLDLDYEEDSSADADANFVLTESGGIVEVQGTAETGPFSEKAFLEMLTLAKKGVGELVALQKKALGEK